ncbi:trypsin-like peptidase [Mucilaginibacter gracilis]|uniref:Trypsin-like peptidase n=1 Tax=Mucilaginibacter gracilis TaxID=423350 RepID=A0A495J6U8_9SPHI|nr:serine protease [Mucilaginibacter gracilis]RKR84441.1 trypsin-like peptidase [Mucilaginibacter gracilis]
MPATVKKTIFSAKVMEEKKMSDIELLAVIERYLNGEMTADERTRFEILRNENTGVDSAVKEHQEFTARIKQYGERVAFENLLNDIHNEIDVQALKDEFVHHPSLIVRLWRNHHSKISVAASIAIFAVLGTLFFTGYLKTQNTEYKYTQLSREVGQIKKSNEDIKSSLTHLTGNTIGVKPPPSNYHNTGTGFALTTDGYLATNFHVVSAADSVYVQNADGEAFHAKIISTDPAHDIAILKISDPSFKALAALPYGFKKSKSDMGEDVFTYGYSGYSKEDGVYTKGYLSSGNGYKGDTVKYQLSMDVDFGNSGGPVFDSRGNIIAMVSGKVAHADGNAFAIKSKYLFKAIQSIQSDSLKSDKIILNTKSKLTNVSRTQQISKLQNYVFMVKVYQ